MERLDDRKTLVATVLVGARKLIGLAFVLEGVVSLLVYEFGGGRSNWGIDGYSLPNWRVDLKITFMFWPIAAPFWLALLCLAVGGFWSVLFGRAWLIWALRVISTPMGALATWALVIALTSGNEKAYDTPEYFSVLVFSIAPWIIPIRKQKSSQAADGTESDTGGG